LDSGYANPDLGEATSTYFFIREAEMAILLKGLRGEPVKRLQEKLGVEAD